MVPESYQEGTGELKRPIDMILIEHQPEFRAELAYEMSTRKDVKKASRAHGEDADNIERT
jgi:hypothetical protein